MMANSRDVNRNILRHFWDVSQHERTNLVLALIFVPLNTSFLSTIQRLDRIVVLDDGKILEDGSHADLLQRNELYAKLWAHQSGGFIED